ncbi:hypothetical protein RI054_09g46600 [Pseudoscourfieldia marina]
MSSSGLAHAMHVRLGARPYSSLSSSPSLGHLLVRVRAWMEVPASKRMLRQTVAAANHTSVGVAATSVTGGGGVLLPSPGPGGIGALLHEAIQATAALTPRGGQASSLAHFTLEDVEEAIAAINIPTAGVTIRELEKLLANAAAAYQRAQVSPRESISPRIDTTSASTHQQASHESPRSVSSSRTRSVVEKRREEAATRAALEQIDRLQAECAQANKAVTAARHAAAHAEEVRKVSEAACRAEVKAAMAELSAVKASATANEAELSERVTELEKELQRVRESRSEQQAAGATAATALHDLSRRAEQRLQQATDAAQTASTERVASLHATIDELRRELEAREHADAARWHAHERDRAALVDALEEARRRGRANAEAAAIASRDAAAEHEGTIAELRAALARARAERSDALDASNAAASMSHTVWEARLADLQAELTAVKESASKESRRLSEECIQLTKQLDAERDAARQRANIEALNAASDGALLGDHGSPERSKVLAQRLAALSDAYARETRRREAAEAENVSLRATRHVIPSRAGTDQSPRDDATWLPFRVPPESFTTTGATSTSTTNMTASTNNKHASRALFVSSPRPSTSGEAAMNAPGAFDHPSAAFAPPRLQNATSGEAAVGDGAADRPSASFSPRLHKVTSGDDVNLSGGERTTVPERVHSAGNTTPARVQPRQDAPAALSQEQSNPVFHLQVDSGYLHGAYSPIANSAASSFDARSLGLPGTPPTPRFATSTAAGAKNVSPTLTDESVADSAVQTVLTGFAEGGTPARRLRVAATDANSARRQRSIEASTTRSAPVTPRSHEEEGVDTSPPRRSRERAAAAAADLQGSIFDRLTSLETESTRRQKIAKSKERATLERTRARHAAKHGTWQ